MKLVFFAHPAFLGSQSMARFSSLLSKGMLSRGYEVEIWQPKPFFFNMPLPQFFKKWMGYVDQYIVFKFWVMRQIRQCPANTVFVFTDQALGPWVPWIKNRPHAIHCHDFLAQRSALGQIKENPTKWFGRQYQAYIRRGYRQGSNFISVSKKTQADLNYFLTKEPKLSTVIYNGLNQSFLPGNSAEARTMLSEKIQIDLSEGYILHIGGNQWYKNRVGVVDIYNAFRRNSNKNIPLLLVGQQPSADLLNAQLTSAFKSDIHFLTDIEDDLLRTAYVGASVFVFPSLAEGFGWPIAEGMASGCLVVTTNEDPMKEVAGSAGFLIDAKPFDSSKVEMWANSSAKIIDRVLGLSSLEKDEQIKLGLENSKRFNADEALDEIEKIYIEVSQKHE